MEKIAPVIIIIFLAGNIGFCIKKQVDSWIKHKSFKQLIPWLIMEIVSVIWLVYLIMNTLMSM